MLYFLSFISQRTRFFLATCFVSKNSIDVGHRPTQIVHIGRSVVVCRLVCVFFYNRLIFRMIWALSFLVLNDFQIFLHWRPIFFLNSTSRNFTSIENLAFMSVSRFCKKLSSVLAFLFSISDGSMIIRFMHTRNCLQNL